MHCYKQKGGEGGRNKALSSIDLDAASVEKLAKMEHGGKRKRQ